ncbi:MAG: PPOX class F420-dependent oxidoreductase [Candidatus Limnocylindria bacterium]
MSAFTEAELAYLALAKLGRLATIGQGQPHVVPVGFRHNAELDTIDIGGRDLERTKKFRDVIADPRVAFVVDDVLPPWRPRVDRDSGAGAENGQGRSGPHPDRAGADHLARTRRLAAHAQPPRA